MLLGLAIGIITTLSVALPSARAATPLLPNPCAAAPPGVIQTGRDSASVLHVEEAWISAINAHDTSAVACILSDDFLDTSWQGRLRTKRDQIAGLARPRAYQQRYQDWRVTVAGSTAVVRGLSVVSDSSGHALMQMRFTDVYAYRDGRWQAIAAQETPVASAGRRTGQPPDAHLL